jgi:hypothetical protein
MNKLYIFIAILLFPLSVFAHGSTMGDILIWKGDTLRLDSNPLKFRTDRDSLEKQILNEVKRQTKATFPDEDENGLWLCSWIS